MRYALLFLMLTACTAASDLKEADKTVTELLVSSSKQLGCLNGVKEIRQFEFDRNKKDLTIETRYHMVAFCFGLK